MSIAERDDFASDEAHEAHVEETLANMRDAGVSTEETLATDYFAFDVHHTLELDGGQWIEHREFTEGQRKNYLNKLNRDMVVQKGTGDMKVKMAAGDERHALLAVAIVDWKLVRDMNGKRVQVPFNPRTLAEFLDKAPPKIIDIIEKAVRKVNPWLMAELSVEDIDKELASLQEMRDLKVKEEEGNSASSI